MDKDNILTAWKAYRRKGHRAWEWTRFRIEPILQDFIKYVQNAENWETYGSNCNSHFYYHSGTGYEHHVKWPGTKVMCKVMSTALFFLTDPTGLRRFMKGRHEAVQRLQEFIGCTIVNVFMHILEETVCEGHWGLEYAWYVMRDQMKGIEGNIVAEGRCVKGFIDEVNLGHWSMKEKIKEWIQKNTQLREWVRNTEIKRMCQTAQEKSKEAKRTGKGEGTWRVGGASSETYGETEVREKLETGIKDVIGSGMHEIMKKVGEQLEGGGKPPQTGQPGTAAEKPGSGIQVAENPTAPPQTPGAAQQDSKKDTRSAEDNTHGRNAARKEDTDDTRPVPPPPPAAPPSTQGAGSAEGSGGPGPGQKPEPSPPQQEGSTNAGKKSKTTCEIVVKKERNQSVDNDGNQATVEISFSTTPSTNECMDPDNPTEVPGNDPAPTHVTTSGPGEPADQSPAPAPDQQDSKGPSNAHIPTNGPAGSSAETDQAGAPGKAGGSGDNGDPSKAGDNGNQGEPGAPGAKGASGEAGKAVDDVVVDGGNDDPPPLNPPKPKPNPNPNQSGASGSGSTGQPDASGSSGTGSTGAKNPGSSGPAYAGPAATGTQGTGSPPSGGPRQGVNDQPQPPLPSPKPFDPKDLIPYTPAIIPAVVGIGIISFFLWNYFAYLAKRRRTYRTVRDVPSPPLDEEILEHLQRGELPPPDYGYTIVRDRRPASSTAQRRRQPRVHKRTIIELHLEVLNECEVAAWENVQDEYLQIVVEEFAQELMRDAKGYSSSLDAPITNQDLSGNNVSSTDCDGTDAWSCMETIEFATDRSPPNEDNPWSCMETIQLAPAHSRSQPAATRDMRAPDYIHFINWIDSNKHLLRKCTTQPWFHTLKLEWKQYYQQHAQNGVSGHSVLGEAATLHMQKLDLWKEWVAQQHRHMRMYGKEQQWFQHLLNNVEEDTVPQKGDVSVVEQDLDVEKAMAAEDILRVRHVPRSQLHKQPYMKKRLTAQTWILILALVIEQCEVECRLQETELYVDDLLAQL
ncbi:hypothetical protein AK88_04933 [Plasmodium fragile]|uniref:Schizont-infected cell agglutination C-terminal domain-containing protein n=1 Tax=Plasmodium fragile TaxID=5857 RepID=A0A0D9QEE1_PLAFR|nr:uncharacterized protein AK88_04933 [Plasmodium fragile]KJP85430.1 hypothetical protein AK88_04933 [Plasmodium fragile]